MAAAEKAGGAKPHAGGRSRRSRGSRPGPSGASPTSGSNPKDVRVWAEANGVQLSGRGRIPASIIEQYKAANA